MIDDSRSPLEGEHARSKRAEGSKQQESFFEPTPRPSPSRGERRASGYFRIIG